MGVLDALFGLKKIQPPKTDVLFKLPPAAVTMESLNINPTGKAGVCFKAVGTKSFDETKKDIVNILQNSAFEARYDVTKDEYGLTWVVIASDSPGDAVANVYMASQLLIDGGFGDHIVCAVFRFNRNSQPLYWIYNYRRGNFYPFAPINEKERDFQFEYRLRLLVSEELPVESLDYWYPIWGIPF